MPAARGSPQAHVHAARARRRAPARSPALIRAAIAFAAAAVALAGARAALRARENGRLLAAPAHVEPASPPPPAAPLAELSAAAPEEIARVGGRVTALLAASDGALYVGTSDAGIVRFGEPSPDAGEAGGAAPPGGAPGAFRPPAPGEGVPIGGLSGRELSVNALAERDGLVWAATQGGLVVLDGARRATTLLEGEGVAALAIAGTSLFAGNARGIFRTSMDGGAEPLAVSGPAGEPLRVTALASGGALLWIGTASGAYSLPLAAAEAPLLSRTARWHPLAPGDPPAGTNAVTALVPLGGGALAGTEDGGVVRLREDGGAAAARFDDERANEVSPGAAAPGGGGTALFGTQGGGLLLVHPLGRGLEVGRPRDLERTRISAVAAGGAGILLGTAEGVVLRIPSPDSMMPVSPPGSEPPRSEARAGVGPDA